MKRKKLRYLPAMNDHLKNPKTGLSVHPSLKQSLTGRVRNFILPPTAENCLMPVYEAVSNALFAIQEKYPRDWSSKGDITIEVLREEIDTSKRGRKPQHGKVYGFVITDNGVGLNDNLFSHFQILDTEYRASLKGKGIGRLSWLKVFEEVELLSVFQRNEHPTQRSFSFMLSNDDPFPGYSEEAADKGTRSGTIINLKKYRDSYLEKAKFSPDEIKKRIIAHYISVFAQPKRLSISIIDEGLKYNLSKEFYDSIVSNEKWKQVEVSEGFSVSILHVLIPKSMAPIGNSLIYCASDRAVVTKSIEAAIDMKALPSEEHGELIYLGLVQGEVFDDALNHERTGFNFGDIDFDELNKRILQEAKEFLDPYLAGKRAENRRLVENFLFDNPLYRSAISDLEKYIDEMPLNFDETKLVQDISVRRHRARRSLSTQLEKLGDNSEKMSDENFFKHVEQLSKELGDTEKSALAQYIVERRLIIELLVQRRRRNADTGKHQAESDVHEVICPLGVTSDVLDYKDHNLWLIDDRLAYYSYIASDRPIKTIASDAHEPTQETIEKREALKAIKAYSEAGEPDLAIFQYPMLFRRVGTPDPVVIVEFKSPTKLTYSGAPVDNPFLQIRKYIESLQAKSCYDADGDRITDITDSTPFHCFLVAEPSEQLFALLRGHGVHRKTPDGQGRFGYLDDLNAYFEFIPYEQVIRNAALRNEAFFDYLKLPGVKGVTQ